MTGQKMMEATEEDILAFGCEDDCPCRAAYRARDSKGAGWFWHTRYMSGVARSGRDLYRDAQTHVIDVEEATL